MCPGLVDLRIQGQQRFSAAYIRDAFSPHLYIYKIGSDIYKKLLSYISNIILILATGRFQFLTNISVFSK